MNPNDSSLVLGITLIVIAAIAALGFLVAKSEPMPEAAPVRWNGKFLIIPGPITSHTGQEHYISAHQLMRLYGVDPRDCVVFDIRYPAFTRERLDAYVALHPRYDSIYDIRNAFADAALALPAEPKIDTYA